MWVSHVRALFKLGARLSKFLERAAVVLHLSLYVARVAP